MTPPDRADLDLDLDLDLVRSVAARIRPYVARTPVVRTASGVALKAESLHDTGSFKTRAAFNRMLQLDAEERARGVIAHSSGNHAIAVAGAAQHLGLRAVIVMPRDAPATKLARTRALGAEVHLVGSGSDERVQVAAALAAEHGYRQIEPYDSLDVVAATATISLELLDAEPEVTEIYAAVSGGGLIAGVAAAAHLLADATGRPMRVIGVEPELAADAVESRRAGRIVTLPADQMARTLADGLRVQQVGSFTWPFVERWVDDLVTVSEHELRDAVRRVAVESRLVIEPSGAVPVAAALVGRGGADADPGRRAAVVGGGNIDPDLLAGLIAPDQPRS